MDEPSLLVEVSDRAAVIRFNRPAQRNSLSVSTLHELDDSLSGLISRADVEAIILTGTGDVFASGADIGELTQLDTVSAAGFSRLGQAVFHKIADAKQITIAAINGYCIGGALDLALACDIRVASRHAVLAHPGAMRGIITGWGGTQRLPRLIGRQRALELFLTARRVPSEEALAIGLVSRVFDPVLTCALQVAASVQTKKAAPNRSPAP